MSGSGVLTGMMQTITKVPRIKTRRARLPGAFAFSAAARGAAVSRSRVLLFGPSASRISSSTYSSAISTVFGAPLQRISERYI